MPRNQAPPEEFESSRRGGAAGREHHEPEPDGRADRADPKRNDLLDEDSIGRPHPSRRDEAYEDDLDDDLDRVSSPGRSAGSGRAPGREAEANELDEADIVERLDLDDLDDDDPMPMDGSDEPDA